jgi:alpha-N-arabinofuranosidase
MGPQEDGSSPSSSSGSAGSSSGASSGAVHGGADAGTDGTALTDASDSGPEAADSGSAPVVCQAGADASAPNTLAVNVDAAKTVISNNIFGVLMERIGKDITGGLYVGTSSKIPNTNGMRNDIIQGFAAAGVGMIEWPGGCAANSYNWNPPNPSNDMGTDDYLQLTTTLGIPPFIAGGGTAAAATANLQWVTYINNNSSHPTWSLNYFKVGNEVWGCGGNQTESAYETNYLANYSALSSPIGGKQLSLVASTGLIGNSSWMSAELKDIGSKIDGIEVHDYIYHPSDIPCVGFSDSQYYSVVNSANAGQIGPRLTQIVSMLDQYDPSNRIKIFEDEWGDWLEPLNKSQDGFFQQITVMDAISTAEQLHLFMQHADRVEMAGMAQAVNVIHSLFLTSPTDGTLVLTPAYYVFKMFLPHHSSNAKWAPSTLTSESIQGNGATLPVLSAGTTVDSAGRVNVSLANVDLVNTRSVEVILNSSHSAYGISTAQVVTGPQKDSYNDFGQPEQVTIQPLAPANYSICGKSLHVVLPPKSVVLLVVAPG